MQNLTRRSGCGVVALTIATVVAALGAGCESEDRAGGGSCVTGQTVGCLCAPGVSGAATCAGGVFGQCVCQGGAAGFGGFGGFGGTGGFAGTNDPGPGGSGGLGGLGGVGGFSGTAGDGGFGGFSGTAGDGGFGGFSGTAGDGGSGGEAGTGGVGGTGGSGGTGATTADPRIPTPTATCPTLRTGNITVLGQQVQLWVGNRREDVKGPVFFYWHGTGSTSGEATGGLGSALTEITSMGGIVASFTTTTRSGTNTGNNVWYTGDFEMADIILKCANEQLNIDARRVYTGGCSAGGLQAAAMVYQRSSYIAAAMPNSGGTSTFARWQLDNPNWVPSVITAHGRKGTDVVIIDFADTSLNFCRDIASKGGFAVDCDHDGRHCASPSPLKAAQWEFLKAHPYGTKPSPYAGGLPGSYPNYCTIIRN